MTAAVETPHLPARAAARPARLPAALRDRLPLLLILLLQAVLAYRLANTAFEDEALYIYAGHRELAFLQHGTPTYDTYASYFSGAPFLYPVAAAVIDGALGLEGVRAFSLLAMSGATVLVWMTARRLYGRPAAIVGAALFAVAAPTLFLSRLATYDAPALFLLALGLWIVVRTARGPVVLALLAAPPLVLAAGVKYAAALYLPSVLAAALVTVPVAAGVQGWRVWLRGATRALLLGGAVTGLIWAWLDAAGPALRAGLSQTTVNRAAGAEPLVNNLRLSAVWGGWVVVLAVAGIVVAARQARRRGLPRTAPVLLAAALTGTALLATVYQAHLGTSVSLHKHVGFGLMFAAPVAGAGLAGLARLDRWRAAAGALPGLAIGVCAVLAFYAGHAAGPMYGGWPDSSRMVAAIRPLVQEGHRRYLVEEDEVPRYYLRDRTEPYEWLTTYYFQYTDKKGNTLTGLPAYQAAIGDRYFDLVVLDFGPTAALDAQLTTALKGSGGRYHLVARVPGPTSDGMHHYAIWQRTQP